MALALNVGTRTDKIQEKQRGEYEIKDSSFLAVCKMVEFMYTGTYEPPPVESTSAGNISADLCFHARMVALADKYLVSALFEIASDNFATSVESESNPLALLGSVPDVYAVDTDGSLGLRKVLVKTLDETLAEVGRDTALKKAVEDVVEAVPSFSTDLLKSVLRL